MLLSMCLRFRDVRNALSPSLLDAPHSSSLLLVLPLLLPSISSCTMKPSRLSESELDAELDSRHFGARIEAVPVTLAPCGRRAELPTCALPRGCDGPGSLRTGSGRRSLRRHTGASAACVRAGALVLGAVSVTIGTSLG